MGLRNVAVSLWYQNDRQRFMILPNKTESLIWMKGDDGEGWVKSGQAAKNTYAQRSLSEETQVGSSAPSLIREVYEELQ